MGENIGSTDPFRWGLLRPLLPHLESIDLIENSYTVGSSDKYVHIVSDLPEIEPLHFSLTKINNPNCFRTCISNLSKGGTYINECLLMYSCPTLIFNGDVIAIGLNCQEVYEFRMFVDVYRQNFWLPPSLRSEYLLGPVITKGTHKTVFYCYDKPENVLITRLPPYFIAKIADYGLADEVKTPITEFTDFVAPEVAQGISRLAASSDVWSLGEILYLMVYKRYPFDGKDRMLKIACYNAMNNLDGDIFPETVDSLLGKMLCICLDERLCLDDVDTHPWIAKDLLMRKVIDQLLSSHTGKHSSSNISP